MTGVGIIDGMNATTFDAQEFHPCAGREDRILHAAWRYRCYRP